MTIFCINLLLSSSFFFFTTITKILEGEFVGFQNSHGLLTHKNGVDLIFLNIRRRVVRVLKLYWRFILTKKGNINPQNIRGPPGPLGGVFLGLARTPIGVSGYLYSVDRKML